MKLISLLLLMGFVLGLLTTGEILQAGPVRSRPKPPVYLLNRLAVMDVNPRKYLWLIQEAHGGPGFAYKSLAAPGLLFWVNQQPPGAEIRYTPASFPIPNDENGQDVLAFSHA